MMIICSGSESSTSNSLIVYAIRLFMHSSREVQNAAYKNRSAACIFQNASRTFMCCESLFEKCKPHFSEYLLKPRGLGLQLQALHVVELLVVAI